METIQDLRADFLKQFVSIWLNAWNSHDPREIKNYMAPDVVFHSPHLWMLYGRDVDHLTGRESVFEYMKTVMALVPHICFKLKSVYMGNQCLIIEYSISPGAGVSEFIVFNELNKISEVQTCFAI